MAPAKQSLLPLGMFVKQPSKATKKKHRTLQKRMAPPPPKLHKVRIDKAAVKRRSEQEDVIRGAEKWRYFLQEIGVDDVARFRCDVLYLSNGEAPDPHAFAEEEEEGYQEYKTRWNEYLQE